MEDILLIPSKTLPERVGNLFRGQQVTELDPAYKVAAVWPELPNDEHLHVIVRLPSDEGSPRALQLGGCFTRLFALDQDI
jgi:hypothetical protein